MTRTRWTLAVGAMALLGLAVPAAGGTIAFEALPESQAVIPIELRSHRSTMHSFFPLCAADFVPEVGGALEAVEWWGTPWFGGGFIITIHGSDESRFGWGVPSDRDAGGVDQSPFGGIGTDFAHALPQTDPGGAGFSLYHAAWTAAPVTLAAGERYWMSIGTRDREFQWAATEGFPTAGSQLFGGRQAQGLDPRVDKRVGPWDEIHGPIPHMDFAFRITVAAPIPEPATGALFALGLMGLGLGLSRRRRARRS